MRIGLLTTLTFLSTFVLAAPPRDVSVEPESTRASCRRSLPNLFRALTLLEKDHADLVFDEWHGADVDLAELRRRTGLRDWDAPFERDRFLEGLQEIYGKVAGNAEMRAVLAQLDVREALVDDLDTLYGSLDEDEPEREQITAIVERLHRDLLVQRNDGTHAIRLTGVGLLQRLRVVERASGNVLFDGWVTFDRKKVAGELVVVLPRKAEELPPGPRAKVRAMLSDERLEPYLNCGC